MSADASRGNKCKVTLEALRGDKSIAELAQIYDVHPTQISQWKKQLLEASSRQRINPALELPVSEQCRILGIPGSSYYYKSKDNESPENLDLMEKIDQIYLAHP